MELNGNATPDESMHSEDSISSLSTMSKSTKHNDDCFKKLEYIIYEQARILRILIDHIGSILPERNEQNEKLVTVYKYFDKITQGFTSVSSAQRPATQQNRQGKKRDSKESSSNAPLENVISTEVSGHPMHCRPNIRRPRENAACNSPSIPPTSGGIEPYSPLKRAKVEF